MSQTSSNLGTLIGQRLGEYELVALLALGGTAAIYLARVAGVAGFEKFVVVKCLHDYLADDSEFVRMFLDEARIAAQMDHTNIVQTLGLGEQDGRFYIVMEYLAGMSLALIVRRATERVPGGRLPVDLVLGIAAQVCAGMHYAHQLADSAGQPLHIVHRDISPQNLVVSFEGIVKLVDFGIAKAEKRNTHTKTGTIKGKFAYMSPEQCLAKDLDNRTDVFALGVVVHELFTGRRLFKRESTYDTYRTIVEGKVPTPSSLNHEFDPGLDQVVMKALAYEREDRYPTADAFGEALTAELYRRSKVVTSGTVAAFFDQYFATEISTHAERMRGLIAGRRTILDEPWDEPEISGGTGREVVGGEVIDDLPVEDSLSGINTLELPARLSATVPNDLGHPEVSEVSTIDVKLARYEDDGATRVEFNPMETVDNVERAPPQGDLHPGSDSLRDSPYVTAHAVPTESAPQVATPAPALAQPGAGSRSGKSSDLPLPSSASQGLATLPSPAELFTKQTPIPAEDMTQTTLIAKPAPEAPGEHTDEMALGDPAPRAKQLPLPPRLPTSPSNRRKRRHTTADDEFSKAQTEPAGPMGIRAAHEAMADVDTGASPVALEQQATEPVTGLGVAGVPQPAHAAQPLSAPSERFEDQPTNRQTISSVSNTVLPGQEPPTAAHALVPLWMLVLVLLLSAGLGLGVTLLVARLL